MRVTKTCLYCGSNWNLLPAVLFTPLYLTPGCPKLFPKGNPPRAWWKRGGFLLSFKFLTLHIGIEVTYA